MAGVTVDAAVVCDEQYLGMLMDRAEIASADIAACSEVSSYAFDAPQVPATGQVLVDVCASDTCVAIIEALASLESKCKLPNCSSTEAMASWSSASQDFDAARYRNRDSSGSADGSAEGTVTLPSSDSPTGGTASAAVRVGASIAALLVPAVAALLQ